MMGDDDDDEIDGYEAGLDGIGVDVSVLVLGESY